MEIIRRLLLVAGFLGAVFAWLYCRPVLVSAEYVDFAVAKADAESLPTGFLHKDDTLEEFYESRTSGRRICVGGDAWMSIHDRLEQATNAGSPDADLARRHDTGYARDRYYFLPDEPPARELADRLSRDTPLLYVQIGDEGLAAPTFTLVRHDGPELAGRAPDWLLRPHRAYAVWMLLIGIGAYILLPRPKRRPGDIGCSAMSAVVLPDLIGVVMTVGFFALPILIIQGNGHTFSFDGGAWLIPVVACWLLATPGLIILGIAAFNASFTIGLDDDALRIRSWRGSRAIAYADIASVKAIEWRTPGWLRMFAWILVIFARRGFIVALMLDGGRGSGFSLMLRDGRRQRVWTSGLNGWQRIIDRLEQHDVPIDAAVHELAQDA